MCLAIPGRVVAIQECVATVDFEGNQMEADVSLLSDVAVGEYVIVHAGVALQKYDEEEAQKSLELLRQLWSAMQSE